MPNSEVPGESETVERGAGEATNTTGSIDETEDVNGITHASWKANDMKQVSNTEGDADTSPGLSSNEAADSKAGESTDAPQNTADARVGGGANKEDGGKEKHEEGDDDAVATPEHTKYAAQDAATLYAGICEYV